ncbi:MAG: hypothetical protein HFE39_03570 [Clostridiales bacterium]|nr:hypothetical protein [Clostridiales bacterium]
MKYCPSCQRVVEQDIERCPVCHKQLRRKIEDTDPVFLLETSILESERLEAAMEDEGIPFASRTPKKEPSATIITGNKNASINVYVPFHALERARDLAIGIGILNLEQKEETLSEDKSESASAEAVTTEDATQEMSRGKRLFVRIFSVILFILVVWGVVAGTDFVMNFIKGLW